MGCATSMQPEVPSQKQPIAIRPIRSRGKSNSTGWQLVVGMDFCSDNAVNAGLHKIASCYGVHEPNPYLQALSLAARLPCCSTWNAGRPQSVHAYGFGDTHEADAVNDSGALFSFFDKSDDCQSLVSCAQRYRAIAGRVRLGERPVSLIPLIEQAACHITEELSQRCLVLLVLLCADLPAEELNATAEAVAEAAEMKLSVTVLGVGSGPWPCLEKMHNLLPERSFDNFQFGRFEEVHRSSRQEATFALSQLIGMPELAVTRDPEKGEHGEAVMWKSFERPLKASQAIRLPSLLEGSEAAEYVAKLEEEATVTV